MSGAAAVLVALAAENASLTRQLLLKQLISSLILISVTSISCQLPSEYEQKIKTKIKKEPHGQ